mmetsp:Transcript_26087/g.84280  ORF Transcript_26087/g.84280 Transcript_26087/m.84280 type:complete len:238 (+) Transcript_26087:167-880(+)
MRRKDARAARLPTTTPCASKPRCAVRVSGSRPGPKAIARSTSMPQSRASFRGTHPPTKLAGRRSVARARMHGKRGGKHAQRGSHRKRKGRPSGPPPHHRPASAMSTSTKRPMRKVLTKHPQAPGPLRRVAPCIERSCASPGRSSGTGRRPEAAVAVEVPTQPVLPLGGVRTPAAPLQPGLAGEAEGAARLEVPVGVVLCHHLASRCRLQHSLRTSRRQGQSRRRTPGRAGRSENSTD